MVYIIDLKDVFVLCLSAFLLAVCGFILVFDRAAQVKKRRERKRKEGRRHDL